jgi:hypothetical protein
MLQADVPDGLLPVRGVVFTPEGYPFGSIVVWVSGGSLATMGYTTLPRGSGWENVRLPAGLDRPGFPDVSFVEVQYRSWGKRD